ncbi:MAG: hypothetical protein ACOX5R_01175 [bacterium]
MKVYKTEIVPMEYKSAMPGEIISTEFNTLRVAARDGVLEILELQPAGRRKMKTAEFLRGHEIPVGQRCE